MAPGSSNAASTAITVIPAKAGIHLSPRRLDPAPEMDSRLRGNDRGEKGQRISNSRSNWQAPNNSSGYAHYW
ncbi:hypothetical protein EWH08_13435 [Sphingobium indicum]|uniref:Uncharacterized protein n=1 Tax=Sphingobium indicum TaxID=332055 RepID=A0A4Q4J6I0_9SPHN|nr:hypothetical protein EWH08_13435 [Sphingobium indicum]